eukprot:gene109-145_t
MTLNQKIIKPKMGLLELAKKLGNAIVEAVITASKNYMIKKEKALYEISRKKPILANRVEASIKKAVVEMAIEYPAQGILVSPGGVRSLKALESKKAKEEAHGEIESVHPGYLGCQDTYYVGTFKGIEKRYLNDRVFPFYAQEGIPILRILTDRGTEFKGKVENHSYELYLSVEGIEHTVTKAYSPQTNGICERFHKTMKAEFYDSAMRKKIYTSLEELQRDLDEWLHYYNYQRPHSGKYCYGKTPMQTFRDSKHIAIEKNNELTYLASTTGSNNLTYSFNSLL